MKINGRSQDKTKRLFKFAYLNQPQSIRSLKRSLSISKANIEAFAKNIGDFKGVRRVEASSFNELTHKSDFLQEEQSDRNVTVDNNFTKSGSQRKQVTQYLNMSGIKAKTTNVRPKNKIFRKFLKLQPSSQKNQQVGGQSIKKKMEPIQCSQYQFVLPKSAQNPINDLKKKYWHVNEPKNRNFVTPKSKKILPYNNSQAQGNVSSTQRIPYFQRQKSNPSKVVRYKTESNQKGLEHSLGFLTNYDNSKNNRALNCLVLQLQLNLQIQKKVKSKTQH